MEKKTKVILVFLCLFGLVLRVFWFPDKISFLYDQGRDALIIRDFWEKGKLTLIGPATDIPGIFHGPIFYYLIAPGYFFTKGNPFGASLILIFFNTISIYLIFLLGKTWFDELTGVLSALFLATSYGLIAYARWLSNPSTVPFFVVLLFLSLTKVLLGKEKYLFLVAFCWAVIFHLEVVCALFLLPTLFFIFLLKKPKIKNLKVISGSIFVCFLLLSSYLLFDLRHEFLTTKAVLNLLLEEKGFSLSIRGGLLEKFLVFFRESSFILIIGRLSWAVFLILISTSYSLFCLRKHKNLKILLPWVFVTPISLVFYQKAVHSHFLVAVGPAAILLVSFFLAQVFKKGKWGKALAGVAVLILLFNNLSVFFKDMPKNRFILFYGHQQRVTLGRMKKVVDFIYQDAEGDQFWFEAYNLPYWLSHHWKYVFSWRGKRKYGFVPKEGSNLLYLIIEPDPDRLFLKNWLEEKDKVSVLLERKKIEPIVVEKRRVKRND